MKKLIVLILFLVSLKSIGQTPPVNGSFGSPNTATLFKGLPVSDSGYWFRFSFADTIAANYGILDNCPGIMIRVGDTTYIRSNAANKWLNMMRGGGSGSTPSWQQTLTAGSTLTTNNTVAGGGFDWTHNNIGTYTLSKSSVDRFTLSSSETSLFSPDGNSTITIGGK